MHEISSADVIMYSAAMRASVIVPSFNSRRTIERCLSSLVGQTRRDLFEILVADSSSDGTVRIIELQFPEVRLFHFNERKLPGDARNFAASRACGNILIFFDADCFVEPDWIERVIEAHAGDYAAVGGALYNGNPQCRSGVAHYLFEFSPWLPGSSPREQDDIPGGCLSIKRWAFDRYGPFPEGSYSEDTVLCWRMRAGGERLLFAPSIRIFHLHTMGVSELLRVKAYHGRCFAWQRSRRLRPWKRLTFAVLAPGLPVILLCRVWRRVRGTPLDVEFWKASPLIGLLAIFWCWGEMRGYLSNRQPLPQEAGGRRHLGQQD
jgi:GT2 family glycosyltransferase